jgi:hypothetical protein
MGDVVSVKARWVRFLVEKFEGREEAMGEIFGGKI